jgi:hypothetical protein
MRWTFIIFNKLCFGISDILLESLEDALSPRVGASSLGAGSVCQLALALKVTQTGDAERKSVETKTPNSSRCKTACRESVLCIQTVNKVLISIFPDL